MESDVKVDRPFWIIRMLHDVTNERFHPITFRHAPTPSDDGTAAGSRYKSGGHHTEGFADRSAADAWARELATKPQFAGAVVNVEKSFPWDGEGIPAMVVFFTREGVPI